MVANFETGGAAINALAAAAGLELKVVALDLDRPTGDFTTEPAMSEADCLAALSIGAAALAHDELHLLVRGAMGLGNSPDLRACGARRFAGTARAWAGPRARVAAAHTAPKQ